MSLDKREEGHRREGARLSQTVARVEAVPEEWFGSVGVCNAIFEALSQHLTLPDPEGAYMWCACGWRSDERPGSEPGPAAVVHVTNAVHVAVTPAIQESLRSRIRAALTGPTETGD